MSQTRMRAAALCVAALFFTALTCLSAQERALRSGVDVSVAVLNSDQTDHYFGCSISYFRYVSKVVAFKLDAAYFPETMPGSGPYGGGKTSSAGGAALVGWHGKRFSMMGEVGGGTLSVVVAGGANVSGVVFFATRHYPMIILGGIIEKSLTRRLALTYEIRDNWAFQAASSESILGGTFNFPSRQPHEPEGRGGLTFRF